MLTKTDRNKFVTKERLKKVLSKNNKKLLDYVDARFNTLEYRLEPLERFEKIIEETNHKLVEFKDAIMGEIVTMREELAITLGHRDILEDHETRITKLEKKSSKPN